MMTEETSSQSNAEPQDNTNTPRAVDWQNPRVAAILSAAATCFARKGFSATTLAEIGKELGLRKSIVHYNFANPWGHCFDRWGQNFIADASGGANYFATAFSGKAPQFTGQADFGPFKYQYRRSMRQFFPKRVRPTAGCEIVSSRHFPPEVQGNYLLNNCIGFQGVLQQVTAQLELFVPGIAYFLGFAVVDQPVLPFAFTVFAVASVAQLVVGALLDRFGPRSVFMTVAAIQIVFFSLMPGLADGMALAVALGFMLGAFGQIPINDYMIGKMASGAYRARIYGIRYVVAFSALAATLPLIAFVYDNWGFDTLFRLLAGAAMVVLIAVSILPKRLPSPDSAPAAAE